MGGDSDTITSQQSLAPAQRETIIKAYFKQLGLSIDLDDDNSELYMYEPNVVNAMMEVVKGDSENFLKHYRQVCQINSMIHAEIAKKEDADEAVLESLYHIVPRSDSQSILELAKKDLRKFYIDQPDHCRELLRVIGADLDRGLFHTQDAIAFLEASLHNWAPLARLNKYIKDFGERVR